MTPAAPSRRQQARWAAWRAVGTVATIATLLTAYAGLLYTFGAITNQVGDFTRTQCATIGACCIIGAVIGLGLVILAAGHSGPTRRGS